MFNDKKTRRLTLIAAVLLPVVAFAATLAVPASAHTPDVYLNGAERWTESDCDDETPIVVASDAGAQSDIYAAVMLAGVIGTDCVILAGPRDGAMSEAQRERLDNAERGGFVVGGSGAVPVVTLGLRDMTRVSGASRWDTTQLVGRYATGDMTAGTSTADEARVIEDTDGDGISEPILPYQAWLAYQAEIIAHLEECGWWDSDNSKYRECYDPEDTQLVVQIKSDFYGCQYDLRSSRCEGQNYYEYQALRESLACPNGWHLSRHYYRDTYVGDWCFLPDHPSYR